jgi:hypothetical protein
MHRRGLRLSSIAISLSDRPAWARLTMQVHDEDVAAVLGQLERHIMAERVPEVGRAGMPSEGAGSYRWQADGACDEDAA